MTRAHPAPGGPRQESTPEQLWRDWLPRQAWPELVLSARTVLVCAAHPDDDVLAVGGLLSRLGAGGTRLRLLAATDGDASHPGSAVLSPAELARRRIAETADALAELGVRPERSTRLGLPDGGLAAVEGELTRAVVEAAAGADVVLAPWARDAHPDHDALGRAAAVAAATHGIGLLAFPVWTWHWAVPDDPRVPWGRARTVRLAAADRRRKQAAIARFTTQVQPLSPAPEDAVVLPPEMLAHFDRDAEVVFGDVVFG